MKKDKVKVKKHWSKKKNLWLLNLKSSNINMAGYHYEKRILYIQFKNEKDGSLTDYKYIDVAFNWWTGFTLADSKGKHFAKAKYDLVDMKKLN